MFGKKKKTWFIKIFVFKNHFLENEVQNMILTKKKHDKKMGYPTKLYTDN